MNEISFQHEAPALFLYGELMQELNHPSINNFYLYGGRGVGKTTFLKTLFREQGEDSAFVFLSGVDWQATLSRLEALQQESDVSKTLLIDDLDYLYTAGYEFYKEEFEGISLELDKLFKQFSRMQSRIIATGTNKPSNLYAGADRFRLETTPRWWKLFWSFIEMQWDSLRFNPWQLHWQDQLKRTLEERYAETLDAEVLSAWQETIIVVTGGHPTLVDPAIKELNTLLTRPSRTPRQDELVRSDTNPVTEPLQATIRRYLEDKLIQSGFKHLRRSLYQVRELASEIRSPLQTDLIRLAKGIKVVPGTRTREILTDHALIYEDQETGQYIVPGSLLRDEILQSEELKEKAVVLDLIPDPVDPDRKGTVSFKREGMETHTRLSGGPWILLGILFRGAGEVISLDEMVTQMGRSQYGVRSALQRLDSKLQQIGGEGLVQNVRGKGYRLDLPVM
jgi:hypothetical protein